VARDLLLYKAPDCGYVNWFSSYLTNRMSHVRYSGALSSLFELLSCFLQGVVLEPLLFKIFINYLCYVIKFSRCLLSADEIHFFGQFSRLLFIKADTDSIRNRGTSNRTKVNIN
jgi:hypothetical protein